MSFRVAIAWRFALLRCPPPLRQPFLSMLQRSSCGSTVLQPTANSVSTACVRRGGKPNLTLGDLIWEPTIHLLPESESKHKNVLEHLLEVSISDFEQQL